MNITILEETSNKIFLGYKNINCPFCGSNCLVIQQRFDDIMLNKKGIREFLNKEVYIKKDRYKCKNCNKTFSVVPIFKNRIFDDDLKPFLKILIDRRILKIFEINQNVLNKLDIDSNWKLLRANKTITVINIKTLEIKEFIQIIEKEKNLKTMNGKKILVLTKTIKYEPFYRKVKYRIK